MFEETLEFMNAIILCYGMQKFIVLHQIILKAQVWVNAKQSPLPWIMLY